MKPIKIGDVINTSWGKSEITSISVNKKIGNCLKVNASNDHEHSYLYVKGRKIGENKFLVDESSLC